MKIATSVVISALGLFAVASPREQGYLGRQLGAQIQAPTFPPLTVAEKQAALKQFGSGVSVTSTPGTIITLTAQAPYNPGMEASLNTSGACEYQSAHGWNQILMLPNSTVMVEVNRPDPSRTYLVTFNICVDGTVTAKMMTGKTNTSDGLTSLNPVQPVEQLKGAAIGAGTPASVPIVLTPSNNSAELAISASNPLNVAKVCSVTIETL